MTPVGQSPPLSQVTQAPFIPTTTTTIVNKFNNGPTSFDNQNQLPSRGTFNSGAKENVANKFTGSFGGPSGVLKVNDRI